MKYLFIQQQQFQNFMQSQRKTLNLIISGRYSRQNKTQRQLSEQPKSSVHNRHKYSISDVQQIRKSKNHALNSNTASFNAEYDEKQREKEQEQAKKMLSIKYKTFMKWDFNQSLPNNFRMTQFKKTQIKADKKQSDQKNNITNLSQMMKSENTSKKNNKKYSSNNDNNHGSKDIISNMPESDGHSLSKLNEHKNHQITPQMQQIKLSRRQRFIKLQNPIQFLKHYIEKQNYIPTTEQKHLIQSFLSLQKTIEAEVHSNNSHLLNLQPILQNIYKLMNLTVDYNEFSFLGLLISLAADICYHMKDLPRSFYFYNQARLAGTYSKKDNIKIPALMGMARICFDLQMFDESKLIFKKSLQYAWRSGDANNELQVYDSFGQIYNQNGKIRLSLYYHEKFTKSLLQPSHSALKKISKEMLKDYDEHIQSLEYSNLDSLFLEYLHLPLNKNYQIKTKNPSKVYKNYDSLGSSPRMKKKQVDFSRQSFPTVYFQVKTLLQEDYEFKNEIADPDRPGSQQLTRLFEKGQKGEKKGNQKRQLNFEHSIQFNRIMNKKAEKPAVEGELRKSLDQKIKIMLNQKLDPRWYQHMVAQIKKKRYEKVGALKEKIRNSHLSYSKYPSERKRQSLYGAQKITESFNRTLLNWIDPIE